LKVIKKKSNNHPTLVLTLDPLGINHGKGGNPTIDLAHTLGSFANTNCE